MKILAKRENRCKCKGRPSGRPEKGRGNAKTPGRAKARPLQRGAGSKVPEISGFPSSVWSAPLP